MSEAAPRDVDQEPGQKDEQNKSKKKMEVFVMDCLLNGKVVKTAQV